MLPPKLQILIKTFDLVPINPATDRTFETLRKGITKVNSLTDLKSWWGKNQHEIKNLPDDMASEIVQLKDSLKGKLR